MSRRIGSDNSRDILKPFMKKYKNLNKTINERYRMKLKHRLELHSQIKDKAAIKHLDRYFMNRLPTYLQTKRSYRRKLVGYRPTTTKKSATTKKGATNKKNIPKKGRQGGTKTPDATTEGAPSEGTTNGEGAPLQPGADDAEQSMEYSDSSTPPNTLYSPNVVLPDPLRPYILRNQFEAMVKDFPNVNMTIETIGRTASFNELLLIKASAAANKSGASLRTESKYIDEVPEKKILLIVHSLTLLDIKLIDCLSTIQGLKELFEYYFEHLDKYDFYIIPIANPDGFSETADYIRFYNESNSGGLNKVWDKNLALQKGSCVGVNLDRNFDVGWTDTSNINPCRQDYPGPRPFSETETQAIREIFHQHNQRMGAYIHVHAGSYVALSYKGDAVLYPKGYTDVTSEDDKYVDLRGEIEEALKLAGFKSLTITVDTLYTWYGKVSGTSVDYAAAVYGIPYAMEFVMQAYDVYVWNKLSVREVWRRVINTTFVNINKIRTTDLYEKKR